MYKRYKKTIFALAGMLVLTMGVTVQASGVIDKEGTAVKIGLGSIIVKSPNCLTGILAKLRRLAFLTELLR